jgi:hypothetical protein
VYASGVGLILVMAGSGLLLDGLSRDLVWAVFAVLAVLRAVGERGDLSLHSVVYLAGGAWVSGLLGAMAHAFGAPAGTPWPSLTLGAVGVVVAAVVIAVLSGRVAVGRRRALLRSTALGLAALGGGAALLYGAAPRLEESAGALATWRTAILAAAAVAASVVRARGWREAAPLAYGLLLLGLVKLLAEDFPRGRPATLMVGLALYGVALILVARSVRGAQSEEPEGP